jgi:hypothetical protein
VYYVIANASALTLSAEEGRPVRLGPVIGILGCLVLAFALPVASVLTGATVIVLGASIYGTAPRASPLSSVSGAPVNRTVAHPAGPPAASSSANSRGR